MRHAAPFTFEDPAVVDDRDVLDPVGGLRRDARHEAPAGGILGAMKTHTFLVVFKTGTMTVGSLLGFMRKDMQRVGIDPDCIRGDLTMFLLDGENCGARFVTRREVKKHETV